jgi:hypothetical protein
MKGLEPSTLCMARTMRSGSTRHTTTQRAASGEVIHSGGIIGRNVGHVPPGSLTRGGKPHRGARSVST